MDLNGVRRAEFRYELREIAETKRTRRQRLFKGVEIFINPGQERLDEATKLRALFVPIDESAE